MTYIDEWRSIAALIQGLARAGELHAGYLQIQSADTYGAARGLGRQAEACISALKVFRERFGVALAPAALEAINRIVERAEPMLKDASGSSDGRRERIWAALVELAAFESEMSFLLSDAQAVMRKRSERAFLHLQRSIVADAGIRERWNKALTEGERACEQLGAIHLLSHGVWAFKVDAAGGRTDLVYQAPLEDLSMVSAAAEGLVLTEWKVAAGKAEGGRRFVEARAQAERYAAGVLGGLELAGCRYLVVVSNDRVDEPPDLTKGDLLYRHINIAVSPRTPSRP